jgi:hypothetical protein
MFFNFFIVIYCRLKGFVLGSFSRLGKAGRSHGNIVIEPHG